jgi:hypothetical protein
MGPHYSQMAKVTIHGMAAAASPGSRQWQGVRGRAAGHFAGGMPAFPELRSAAHTSSVPLTVTFGTGEAAARARGPSLSLALSDWVADLPLGPLPRYAAPLIRLSH